MLIFPSVEVKAPFIKLKRNAVPHFTSKHHLIATHVIHHNVLQLWHQSVFINKVEVNIVIGCNLNSNVTFDVINKSSFINCVIELPRKLFCHFVFSLLEEQNL